MRDIELEMAVGSEKVHGVSGFDLRDEMKQVFRSGEYTPEVFKDILNEEFLDSDVFAVIIDIASFAAQCAVRRANNLKNPL